MQAVLVVIHVILAVALIAVVLLQRSEGGALGIGGGGGMSGFMTGRGAANLLTRATAVLALCFMLTSLGLAWLAGRTPAQRSLLDQPPTHAAPIEQAPVAPAPTPAPATPAAPTAPTVPTAPKTPAPPIGQ
ncbi:MAG TPA: preprotein translocase subunit SecG [Alphaproteobacteria bacterium]|nr:preprotein translocase subunit SecG [Alphaproteobacteria bacterium]